ncbi:MAG: hypothetical protein ACRDJC_19745 [Thermomicrobiales bacterium]
MDTKCFDAFVRSLPFAVPRRTTLGGVLGAGVSVLLARFATEDAAGKKRRKKKKRKRCKGGKKRCGKGCCSASQTCVNGKCQCTPDEEACGAACCPASQACVNGECGCPEAACAAAIDPTDDQFENCLCDVATDGGAHCVANIACGDPPPTCQETSECDPGEVCLAISCQAVSRCTPVCSLR